MKTNNELMTAALYANGYSAYVPWAESIGFQTFSSTYVKQENRYSAAENFLLNSRNMRFNQENEYSILSYLDDRGLMLVSQNNTEYHSSENLISLPEGIPLDIALGEAIVQRRSRRAYTGDSFHLSYLASIIRAGFAVTAQAAARLNSEGQVQFSFRTVPSAGGLYPIDLYLAALNIDGLAKGLYRYLPLRDSLVSCGEAGLLDRLMKSFLIPNEMINIKYANTVLILAARPWKTMRKYGDRGLRFVFHEAGAISQNIHLASAALGLGSVDCASICDDEFNETLNFDGMFKTTIHVLVIGTSG